MDKLKHIKTFYLGTFALIILFLYVPKINAQTNNNLDINGDGIITAADYDILVDNFSNPYSLFDFNKLISQLGTTFNTPSPTVVPTSPPTAAPTIDEVNVGAIYFSGSHGTNRNEIEGLLAKDSLKYIWPYFTIVRSPDTIDIHEDDQRIMDQEIDLAADAGIDYFAFHGGDQTYGFRLYMNSTKKNRLKFALMGSAENIGSPTMIAYFQDPQYYRVPPLNQPLFIDRATPSDLSVYAQNVEQARLTAKQSIGVKPFIATQLMSPNFGSRLSLDARSFYFISNGCTSTGQPYSSLANGAVSAWDSALHTSDVIPTAMIGLDPRPKIANYLLHDWGSSPPWCENGTPSEIANHVKAAYIWAKRNSSSKTILLYAWNEYAEGGWLVPTIEGGNSRLNAIARAIGGIERSAPISPYIADPPAEHPMGYITIESPLPNTIIASGQQLILSGRATAQARMNIKIGGKLMTYINGKGGGPNRSFSITVPKPDTKGVYNLIIESPDIPRTVVNNITFQ